MQGDKTELSECQKCKAAVTFQRLAPFIGVSMTIAQVAYYKIVLFTTTIATKFIPSTEIHLFLPQ